MWLCRRRRKRFLLSEVKSQSLCDGLRAMVVEQNAADELIDRMVCEGPFPGGSAGFCRIAVSPVGGVEGPAYF